MVVDHEMNKLLLILLVLSVLPVIAWSRRALFAIVLVVGGLLFTVWLNQQIASSKPGYDSGPFGFFAIVLLHATAAAFAVMAVARMAGLALQGRGGSRLGVAWVDALGLAVAAAVVVGPRLVEKYVERRPPPQACLDRPIPVTLGARRLRLPHNPSISLYLPGAWWDRAVVARYLHTPSHHRDLCRRTTNGRRAIEIAAVSIRFRTMKYRPVPCKRATLDWEHALCREDSGAIAGRFPRKLLVFQPGAIREGALGTKYAKYSRYKQSRREIQTADGNPLTVYCREREDRAGSHCEVDRMAGDGLQLRWDFETSGDEVSEELIELQARIDAILASIADQADLTTPPGRSD